MPLMHEKSAVWSGFPLESAVLHFLPCTVSCSGPLADSRRIARDQIQEGFLSGSDQIRCNRPKNVINLPDLHCTRYVLCFLGVPCCRLLARSTFSQYDTAGTPPFALKACSPVTLPVVAVAVAAVRVRVQLIGHL